MVSYCTTRHGIRLVHLHLTDVDAAPGDRGAAGRSRQAPCHPTRYSISTGRKSSRGFGNWVLQRGSMSRLQGSPLAADLSPRDGPTEPHWPAPAPSVPCSTRLALAAARWAHRIGTTIVGTSILRPNCLTSLLSNLRACDCLPRGIVRSGRWPRPPGHPLVHSQCQGGCPPAQPPKAESSSAPNCTVRAAGFGCGGLVC